MFIKNPINKRIEVKIQGTHYVLEALGTLDNVSEQDAYYWKKNLHQFIIVSDSQEEPSDLQDAQDVQNDAPEVVEEAEEVEEIEETPAEITEETTEEISEVSEVAEAPVVADSKEVVETKTEKVTKAKK